MYLIIKRRVADNAISVIPEAECQNGSLVLLGGYAAKTIGGVDVAGEALEGKALTDAVGNQYAVVAPDVTADQRYSLQGKTDDDLKVLAGEPTRAYINHAGFVVKAEKALIDVEVVEGDLLAPKAGTQGYTKYVDGTNKNAIARVLKTGVKHMGRDMVEIIFL